MTLFSFLKPEMLICALLGLSIFCLILVQNTQTLKQELSLKRHSDRTVAIYEKMIADLREDFAGISPEIDTVLSQLPYPFLVNPAGYSQEARELAIVACKNTSQINHQSQIQFLTELCKGIDTLKGCTIRLNDRDITYTYLPRDKVHDLISKQILLINEKITPSPK